MLKSVKVFSKKVMIVLFWFIFSVSVAVVGALFLQDSGALVKTNKDAGYPASLFDLAYEKAMQAEYEDAVDQILKARNDDKNRMKAVDTMLFETLSFEERKSDKARLLVTLEILSENMDLGKLSSSDVERLSEYCARAGAEAECIEISSRIPDEAYRKILRSGWVHSVIENDPRYIKFKDEIERMEQRAELTEKRENQISVIMNKNVYLTRHEAESIQASLEQVRDLRCLQEGAEWYGIPPNTNRLFPQGLLFKCP